MKQGPAGEQEHRAEDPGPGADAANPVADALTGARLGAVLGDTACMGTRLHGREISS